MKNQIDIQKFKEEWKKLSKEEKQELLKYVDSYIDDLSKFVKGEKEFIEKLIREEK